MFCRTRRKNHTRLQISRKYEDKTTPDYKSLGNKQEVKTNMKIMQRIPLDVS